MKTFLSHFAVTAKVALVAAIAAPATLAACADLPTPWNRVAVIALTALLAALKPQRSDDGTARTPTV